MVEDIGGRVNNAALTGLRRAVQRDDAVVDLVRESQARLKDQTGQTTVIDARDIEGTAVTGTGRRGQLIDILA